MPNIFLVSPRLTEEDRFTRHWEYLLHNCVGLPQAILDLVCLRTGLSKSKFQSMTDHPKGYGRGNAPDFLMTSEGFDIVFEHKLDSNLGPQQLERYVSAVSERPNTYLALIGNQSGLTISDEVQNNSRYLAPRNEDCPYFLWESFYTTIRQQPEKLADEFIDYMDSFGMVPWDFGEWRDPFSDAASATQFGELWRPVKAYFKNQKTWVGQKSNPLGLEVRKPHPEVVQYYIHARKGAREFDHVFGGRGVFLRVFLETSGSSIRTFLNHSSDTVPGYSGASYSSSSSPMRFTDTKCLVREYGVPLENILRGSLEESKNQLLDFVAKCDTHVMEELASNKALETDT